MSLKTGCPPAWLASVSTPPLVSQTQQVRLAGLRKPRVNMVEVHPNLLLAGQRLGALSVHPLGMLVLDQATQLAVLPCQHLGAELRHHRRALLEHACIQANILGSQCEVLLVLR